ncbi:three-prime repair exonuclease 1-like [Malaya genurostris]|uniref:three-prime repair exonuclease 1-like n=1 Tax=Malaya genurostris TaxID=325434 RepID=UPI0026F3C3A2|nr:three-prime repair exonuclease 1-like [Malaya genurostris]
MAKVNSFVFFDLETTDLPGLQTPKITEISLIACSKQHILDTKRGDIPRVLHKQTLCLNPQRVIHPKASEATGLYNDLLENEAKFDSKTAQLISLFLERLQKPMCLVAHNGNRFDFTILKKELEAHGVTLPDDVYCIDSLLLFRHLEKLNDEISQENEKNELVDLELTAILAMEELEGAQSTFTELQKQNETTPQKNKLQENYKRALRSYLDVTPSQETEETKGCARPRASRSKRQLFPDVEGNSNSTSSASSSQSSTQVKPKRFRLCDIFERSFGEPPKRSHYAEDDVETLMKCATADNRRFVAYAEEHCVNFNQFSGKF